MKTRFTHFLAADDGGTPTATAKPEKVKPEDTDDGHVGFFGGGLAINQALEETKIEGDPKEIKKEEPKKEEIVAGGKPEVKPLPEKLSHKNFQEVVDARKKAEAERDKLKAEFDAEKAKWEEERQKIPNVDDLQKRLQQTTADKERLDKDFKAAFAERQVRADYEPRRAKSVEKLAALAQAAGDAGALQAVKAWNYDALVEFADSLTPGQKREWNRELDRVVNLDDEMSEKLKDPEAAFGEFQKRTQEDFQNQTKARIQKHVDLAASVHAQFLENVPALQKTPELSAEIKKELTALAGGEGNERYPAEKIMQIRAEHLIYETLTKNQHATIEALKKENAELKETVKKTNPPSLRSGYVEHETNSDEEHVGFFGGGIKVVTGR